MRERGREREVVASIVTAACGEERSARGRCPCASTVVIFSPIVYSAACGLPWFFPSLWVFHVNTCGPSFVTVLFLFSVHKPTVRLWPSKESKPNPINHMVGESRLQTPRVGRGQHIQDSRVQAIFRWTSSDLVLVEGHRRVC